MSFRAWSLQGILAVAFVFSGCTKFWNKSESSEKEAAQPAQEKVLNLYIWAEYTSPTLLEAFTKKTGIRINESNFSSNEELLAKLQAGVTGYDVIVPSDYMISVMNKLGLLEEINKTVIPNIKNLDPQWLAKPYDPENKYSLPYAWSITGIAVNTAMYKEPVTGWKDLLEPNAAAGRISMLDDVREVLGATLKYQGKSLNSKSADQLNLARNQLIKSKKNFKAFNSTPGDLIASGEVFLAQMYSGEALVAARDSGKPIKFIIPVEGATLAIDNLAVLKTAAHKDAAWEFINFLFEASSNIDFVTRTLAGPVVAGIREQLPENVRSNPSLFPSEAELKNCEMMEDLGETTATYDRIWSELKAASH